MLKVSDIARYKNGLCILRSRLAPRSPKGKWAGPQVQSELLISGGATDVIVLRRGEKIVLFGLLVEAFGKDVTQH